MKHCSNITIAIPFYNAVDTLARCIESVIRQTVKDWELILVDDGSTDGSYEICMRYVEADSRIRIIRSDHKGVGAARNVAIEQAKGNKLCFMDADDYIEVNYMESFCTKADVDLAVCGYKVDHVDKSGMYQYSVDYRHPTLEIDGDTDRLLLERAFSSGIMCFIWNKLFDMKIIREYNIRYNSYPVNEYFIFVLDYLNHSASISFLPKTPYHWVRVDGKTSAVESLPQNLLHIYEHSHMLLAQYLQNDEMAARIAYRSYELIIYKYLKSYQAGNVTKANCFNSLSNLHKSVLVRCAFDAYIPTAPVEKILYILNKRGLFRITYALQKIISKLK